MELNKIYCGKMEIVLPEYCPDNFCDSIVTDPPYGLRFMNKHWDYDVPTVEQWKEAFRVLKPGGFLLAFGGTRTYHRMVVNIEDAGFEIRDQIQWLYGSGFPKSLDISKAIDKQAGAERVVTGYTENARPNRVGKETKLSGLQTIGGEITTAITDAAKEWEGWGTALKPSHEIICMARKPFDESPFNDCFYSLTIKLLENVCQLQSFAKIAEKNLQLNLKELKEVAGIVRWIAEKNINILDVLNVLMATLQLELERNTNWNIVLSWLIVLEECYEVMNTYTTETKINLTTDLEILQSLEWENIFRYFILRKDNPTNGLPASVLNAESILNVLRLKLISIQKLSVQDGAICVARKPVEGTVAENVLKWGTGGLNIDASRIGTDENLGRLNITSPFGNSLAFSGGEAKARNENNSTQGRFPANVILDEFMGEELDRQTGVTGGGQKSVSTHKAEFGNTFKYSNDFETLTNYGDEGGASRFFYCPKPDNFERNKGLKNFEATVNGVGALRDGGRESQPRRNHHPTVKPIDLMRYLVRLVTRKGGIVLDPFCGSGSTLIAAKMELMNYIGIDMDETHIPLAEARVKLWNPDLYKPQTLF